MARLLAAVCLVPLLAGAPASSAGAQAGERCLGKRATHVGGPGNDTLTGTAGADVFYAAAGDDSIHGGGGRDIVCGGDGNDAIAGGAGADELAGEAGDDRVDGGDGLDYAVYEESPAAVVLDLARDTATGWGTDAVVSVEAVVGSRFDDAIRADGGPNYLAALEGDDDVRGGGGNDYLDGGSGNDVLQGGGGFDTVDFFFSRRGVRVNLGSGRASGYGRDRVADLEDVDGSRFGDLIVGNASPNWLRGFGGGDRLLGTGGRDRIEGGAAGDRMLGGGGSDRLAGGPGRDYLDGGRARDRLSGGAGRDVCRRGERLVGCP